MTRSQIRHGLFALTIVIGIYLIYPTIGYTIYHLNDPTENMAYAWLVPIGSILLISMRRKQILSSLGKPECLQALIPLLIMMGCFLFGERGGQGRLSQMALAWSVLLFPFAFYGWRAARWLILPAFFLMFIIPIDFLDSLTFGLRMVTVHLSTAVLNGVGIAVQNVGTAIHSTSAATPFSLDVADPCSGIRSLFGIMAFTALYGAFVLRRKRSRWILFLASFPLAMVGNVIRLFLTGVVASMGGQAAGMTLHDHALFVIGPITFLFVFLISDFLANREKKYPPPQPELAPCATEVTTRDLVLLTTIPVVMVAIAAWLALSGSVQYDANDFVVRTPPILQGYTMRYPAFCQNKACLYSDAYAHPQSVKPIPCPLCKGEMRNFSYAEYSILPRDTRLMKADYVNGYGDVYHCSIVIAGQSRGSIHRPEMCLPAQGFSLTARQSMDVSLPDGSSQPISYMQINRKGMNKEGFCYFFFSLDRRCNTHNERIFSDVWMRTMHNRIIRWCMVTLRSDNDFESDIGREDLQQFVKELLPQLILKGPPDASAYPGH